jgi:Bacterial TSP3 repeat
MLLTPPHRSGMHRRRFIGGLFALVALGLVTVAPMQSASASGPGQITVGARTCVHAEQLANPLDCPVGPVGSVSLTSDSQVPTVLDMNQATDTGDTLVWGTVGDVPLEFYYIDTSNMAVVPGFEISGLVAAQGDAGNTGSGWYVDLTNQPVAEVYAIYTPLDYLDSDGDGLNDYREIDILGTDPYNADMDGDGADDYVEIYARTDPSDASDFPEIQAGPETNGDSDSDGASDEAEIAFGSDPNDARDYPEVQAGPEPGDGTTDETAEVATFVTALPNTGAQPHNDDDTSILLLLGSGAIAAGGLAGTRRLRTSR